MAMLRPSNESGILEKAATLLLRRSWRLMCATSMLRLVNLRQKVKTHYSTNAEVEGGAYASSNIAEPWHVWPTWLPQSCPHREHATWKCDSVQLSSQRRPRLMNDPRCARTRVTVSSRASASSNMARPSARSMVLLQP